MIPVPRVLILWCLAIVMLAGSASAQHTELSVQDLIGTYSHSAQFSGSSITIEPEGRYHTKSSNCTEEFYEGGTYTFKDGGISFTITKITTKSHGESDDQAKNLRDPEVYKEMFQREMPAELPKPYELVPVKWGERLYLMSRDSMVEFCNAINLGLEPRTELVDDWYLGSFFLRQGDEKKRASGRPAFSQTVSEMLLDKPVDAAIINIELDGKKRFAVIDKGSDAGLKPGMRLVITEKDLWRAPSLWGGVVVVSVQQDMARVEIFDEMAIGDKLSSKFVDRRFQ